MSHDFGRRLTDRESTLGGFVRFDRRGDLLPRPRKTIVREIRATRVEPSRENTLLRKRDDPGRQPLRAGPTVVYRFTTSALPAVRGCYN